MALLLQRGWRRWQNKSSAGRAAGVLGGAVWPVPMHQPAAVPNLEQVWRQAALPDERLAEQFPGEPDSISVLDIAQFLDALDDALVHEIAAHASLRGRREDRIAIAEKRGRKHLPRAAMIP